MKNYLPRIADRLLADKLAAKSAVLVKGLSGVAKLPPPSNKQKASCICKTLRQKSKIDDLQKSTLIFY